MTRQAVTQLKGVGPSLAGKLAKLHIASVQDLLFHLPLRYLDRTRITPIGDLRLNTSVVIQGRVVTTQIKFGRRRSLVCTIEDASGAVSLRFFHFSAVQKERLQPGTLLRCYGDPKPGAQGIEFYHPEYDFIDDQAPVPVDTTLTPIYPTTDGLNQAKLRALVKQAVSEIDLYPIEEYLPAEINQRFHTDSLAQALCYVHFPPPEAPIAQLLNGGHPYQQRLAFEELLAHFLVRQELRALHHAQVAHGIPTAQAQKKTLLNSLAFRLTQAQERVIADIEKDIANTRPMLRMIQGDVGSGKTLVAAIAAMHVASAGKQVAVVAPTEILAEQHLANFRRWLEPMGIAVGWLVGRHTPAQKRAIGEQIAEGRLSVILGTHALLQETVQFHDLALAIIDEQHRFGVAQRLHLRHANKHGVIPHQLTMTATPIPRTLAMTAYSELDYSVIDELPPGRKAINTVLISQQRRSEIIERIRVACKEGQQAYWVCTLVEESETLAAANAEATASALRESLPELNIGLVHGRMKPKEKEQAMSLFKEAQTQLLVATTVIEVGVDVPNASLMIIENPERLGLAQLHQLRGRVGRGQIASHCVLLYGTPLSATGKQRLQALRESNDGFVIAERDLALRGPGELIGTRQAGDMSYRLADLERDSTLIPLVHEVGRQLLEKNPLYAKKIVQRWFGSQRFLAQA